MGLIFGIIFLGLIFLLDGNVRSSTKIGRWDDMTDDD